MHHLALFLCLTISLTLPVHAQQTSQTAAHEAEPSALAIGPAGEAYLRAIRFRRVDADVAYYDPTRPPPALDTKQEPVAPREKADSEDGSTTANVIAVLLLCLVGYFVIRFGGRVSVSFRSDEDDPARSTRGAFRGRGTGTADVPGDLPSIAAIKDRRLALVTLAQSALIRAVTQNGLLLQKSWTARDALRRLPGDMEHRDALKDLVAAGERVLFGGRDVPEDAFQDHLTAIKPLFAGGRS